MTDNEACELLSDSIQTDGSLDNLSLYLYDMPGEGLTATLEATLPLTTSKPSPVGCVSIR